MATVEAHKEMSPLAESVYDGFISYSHSADDLLAPRLQAGLQRFAKPWWKRRALRIFRDEASLSANPHLWASITEAMDESDWFVLLLSPAAAESEWVNREIEYWLENKEADRILPVVTDGEFAWGDGDIDASSAAVPPALYGASSDEPRWVDLRFARTEEQLDLNNASFRAAIADIASAIRGIPKDELESEEVRQHRRTIRTAWGAAVALLLLVVVAGAAAIYANGQRLEADEQRVAAEDNATEADAQRQIAEQQTDVAEELAFDARTEALAANAITLLNVDPELSLLLATEALQRDPIPAALSATHQAMQRHRTIYEVSSSTGILPVVRAGAGGMSPAGDLLAVAALDQGLSVWEIGGVEPLWTIPSPPGTLVLGASFTPDGAAVVALTGPAELIDPFRESVILLDTGTLFTFDARTGEEIASTGIFRCAVSLDPSPLPIFVDLARPLAWAAGEECELAHTGVGMLDPQSGRFTEITSITAGISSDWSLFGVPTTDADRRYLAAGAGGPGQVIDLDTGELVFEYDGGISTLSVDGTLLLARGHDTGRPLELRDLVTNEQLWTFPKVFTRAWFSADERLVYGSSLDGSTYVLDAATGDQIHRLVGQDGLPNGVVMTTDGSRLATFADDGTARVWDLGAIRSEGPTYATHPDDRDHMPASADVEGGVAAVWAGLPRQQGESWETTLLDLGTGETLTTVTGGSPALSPDGTRLAYRAVDETEVTAEDLKQRGEPGLRPRVGPVRIVDVATGDAIVEIDIPCVEYLMSAEAVPSADCNIASSGVEWDLEFSPDGRLLGMADSYNDIVIVWDAATGEILGQDQLAGSNARAIAFTEDESQFAVFFGGGIEQRLRVYALDSFTTVASTAVGDAASFAEMVFTPDGSALIAADNTGRLTVFDAPKWDLVEPIAAHQGSVLDVAVNPTGTLIASAGEDAYVRVWNLADRSLATEIQFDVNEIANVEFIDDTHLFVTAGFGKGAIVVTLDPDELLNVARSSLIRSFTTEECASYAIDPCPTLDEIKGG